MQVTVRDLTPKQKVHKGILLYFRSCLTAYLLGFGGKLKDPRRRLWLELKKLIISRIVKSTQPYARKENVIKNFVHRKQRNTVRFQRYAQRREKV